MLFNSLAFAVFLPAVLIPYWALRRRSLRSQNALLLVASYLFYGWWDWRFLSLIIVSSLVDFLVGRGLASTEHKVAQKKLLTVSIATNLGILGFFKYFDFFITSAADLLTAFGLSANARTLGVILPVGISFYTFQTLSYTIDIYRGKLRPTKDPVAFFAFVSFFPQLVAGPIERASNLLPQFSKTRSLTLDEAKDGVRQGVWGLFKKIVIADNLAPHVDAIFSAETHTDGLTLVIGAFFFAIQIFCDFSGYSDVAIGTARLFGFTLMRNFANPYFSRDIAEFWRRWHISLSTWFRDYVYIPLGGSRAGRSAHIFNLMVTFAVSGLWHGANWTFLVWGVLNALYYIPFMLLNRHRHNLDTIAEGRILPSASEVISVAVTFSMTLVAWVFFRADSLSQAFSYLYGIVSTPWVSGAITQTYAWPLALCGVLFIVEWFQRMQPHGFQMNGWPVALRWVAYCAVITIMIGVGKSGHQPFIYFQF